MKLILVRHGHVEGVRPARFRGRRDVPLTPLGQRQANATAARIAAEWRVDAVFTSPMWRAVDTAHPISDIFGLTPQPLPELMDFDYGEWSWKTHEEVRAASPALHDLWFDAPQLVRIPGGDTLQSLALRAADALRVMLDACRNRTVVAVGHDSINRALLLQLLDMPLSGYWRLQQDPCCLNEIDIGAKVSIQRVNEHGHLLDLAKGENSHPENVEGAARG